MKFIQKQPFFVQPMSIFKDMGRNTGLPAARSEISGPNFLENFRTFMSVSRGSRHRKSSFLCAHKCYSLKQISIAVHKMSLRQCYT